jgi:chemotaxis response regulator CheB
MCVDDDPLFVRKMEAYIEEIEWLTFIEAHNNPVQGATAIITRKPDVVFLDIEMPYIDGNYLVDWIKPNLAQMETPPKIIVVSSLTHPPEELLKNADGFINKSEVISADNLETHLKKFIKR